MKRISIRVIPNAKKARIAEENGKLKVYVNAPATEGRANEAVIETLAEHFKVKRRQVRIASGQKNREKTVEIS